MKIGIIAASGKSGQAITSMALQAGHDIVAIVRSPEKFEQKVQQRQYQVRFGDLNQPDSLLKACGDLDILISAYGPSPGQPAQHDVHAATLIKIVATYSKIQRLIVIGGAGSLLTKDGQMLINTKLYPPEWRSDGLKQVKALALYRQSQINWTYFSPAFWYDPDLPLTSDLLYGTDYVLYNKHGESKLGYLDTAAILVYELKIKKYQRKRFTACRA